MPHRGNQIELKKGEERRDKRAATVWHTGATKGNFKGGGGSEKRKREKGAVTVCHKGATKGNFKRGRRRK